METKHTPGPFTIEYKRRFSIKGDTLVVVNAERFPLAFVPAWDAPAEGEEDGSEEARCNARLIAAAPELLEALKELLELTDDPNNDADPEESVFTFARQAIAKAEGQE